MTEDIVSCPASSDAPFQIIIAGISYCDGTYHIHREVSSLYCLEYVRKGQGTVSTDGQTFHPMAGDVYILHAGKKHDYFSDADDPWEKIWFNCTGSLVSALLRVYGLENTYYFPQLDLHAEFNAFLENARHAPHVAHENNVFLLHRILQLAAKSRTAPPHGCCTPEVLSGCTRRRSCFHRYTVPADLPFPFPDHPDFQICLRHHALPV